LREGDYSARVDLRLKNEFAELQDTFNDKADRIGHEISLRKKSEEDRRRLILDISHDLKNPMSSIQGYAELLMKKSDLTEQERNEHLEVILNNSKRDTEADKNGYLRIRPATLRRACVATGARGIRI